MIRRQVRRQIMWLPCSDGASTTTALCQAEATRNRLETTMEATVHEARMGTFCSIGHQSFCSNVIPRELSGRHVRDLRGLSAVASGIPVSTATTNSIASGQDLIITDLRVDLLSVKKALHVKHNLWILLEMWRGLKRRSSPENGPMSSDLTARRQSTN
jgi:hypothetical protein